MIERHLHTPEDWRRWAELTDRHAGRALELEARATLLLDQLPPGQRDPTLALVDAAAIEVAIDSPGPPRQVSGAARWVTAALFLAGLAFAAGRFTGASDGRWRGDPSPDLGTVSVEVDGRVLGKSLVGRGVRPSVTLDGPDLGIRWTPVPGWVAVAWFVGPGPVEVVPAAGMLRVPAGATALVVAVAPDGVDPASLPARFGDGRGVDEPLGEARVVVFDLEAP